MTLAVDAITVRRGGRLLLDGVSLRASGGEIVGVIGPNGAGKTTLFEAVAARVPRETLFYLPDAIRPWPEQRVGWCLRFFARLFARDEDRDAIAALQLEPLLRQRVRSLSKGEAKRFALALALGTPQPVLLLDEPFDGLDFRQTRAAMALLASALSPLDGILVPTLGAYDLAITFLVPFVAIRMVSAEKSSGALTLLLLQTPASMASQLAAKLAALLAGWTVSLLPAAMALVLWRMYGGHLHAPEAADLMLGHTLRYVVTCALAMAAASIFGAASSAAIAVLAVTIGTWALDFFAAGRGGWIAEVAAYTPSAVLRQFERGLLNVDAVIAAVVIVLTMLAVAAAFLKKRVSVALIVVALLFVRTHVSFDLSEDRRSSFSPADERLLRSITQPVHIRMHLAAEDPRANDYERNVLTKLRRSVRDLRVEYPYAGQTALFENDGRYGTIVYRVGNRQHVSRSTTEEIVLDELETLAGLPPPRRGEAAYPGYPLASGAAGFSPPTEPGGPKPAAPLAFYVIWPLLVFVGWWCSRRTG